MIRSCSLWTRRTNLSTFWVIVTDPNPEGLFALVSFTTLRGAKDQTLVLHRGEHPFFKWETCVAYALAEIMSVSKLQEFLDRGLARMHSPASPKLLSDVLAGFSASQHTKRRVLEFIRRYGRPKDQI